MAVDLDQTIVAISSAIGDGMRTIVRLSGENAVAIARSVAASVEAATDPVSLGHGATVASHNISLPGDRQVKADFWIWPTARSYTRQPQVEIHLPGSRPIAEALLIKLQNHGARLARPGEFTMRAFLAGRLDLTQAEAVLGLIDAHGDERFQTALKQLAGGLSGPLQHARSELIELLALLEAGLDFAEEDIEFITPEELASRIVQILAALRHLRDQIRDRGIDQAIPKVVLLGLPNAGKSTLFNCLTGRDEAITSAVAGTTRDFLSQTVLVGDFPIELIDTAGHEEAGSTNALSRLMAAQTTFALEDADLCLLCVDATVGITPEVAQLRERIAPDRRLMVYTKCDTAEVMPSGVIAGIETSVREHRGIDLLKATVRERLHETELARGEMVPTTAARCLGAIERTCEALATSLGGIQSGHSEELVAAEIRIAISQLAEIVGAVYTDDLLDVIFSRFCIGK